MGHIVHLRNSFNPQTSLRMLWSHPNNTISFLKNRMVLICSKLKHLHPRLPYAKLGWNWSTSASGEEYFKILQSIINLPLEKDWVLHLKNLNPLYPRMLCVMFCWNYNDDRRQPKAKITQLTPSNNKSHSADANQ